MKRTLYTPAFIYFARPVDDIGPIKIGSSLNPEKRVKRVAWEFGRKLKIDALGRGDYQMERDLHAVFHKHCIEREWFEPADEILRLMKRLNNGRSLKKIMERTHGTELYWARIDREFWQDIPQEHWPSRLLPSPAQRETA